MEVDIFNTIYEINETIKSYNCKWYNIKSKINKKKYRKLLNEKLELLLVNRNEISYDYLYNLYKFVYTTNLNDLIRINNKGSQIISILFGDNIIEVEITKHRNDIEVKFIHDDNTYINTHYNNIVSKTDYDKELIYMIQMYVYMYIRKFVKSEKDD